MRRPGRYLTAIVLLVVPACAICADEIFADDTILTPQKKAHWAWRAPTRPPLPATRDHAWVRNPIDAFVLAKLHEQGLKPAPPADAVTLLRRLCFDLIGLPPTPKEVDEFILDCGLTIDDLRNQSSIINRQSTIDSAVAKLVDRLLASPHYGERWGRHWLDLARFAESNGYEFDEIRPDAWRYRDYVIRAFNQDTPYDRFILEQLAGDELFPDDQAARIATAFNLLGPDMTDSSNQALRRQNTLDDMTETAGLAFLGLTIGCARCHDHKFEPILQADFFRMQAFFAPAKFRTDIPVADQATLAAHAQAQKRYHEMSRPTLDALAALETPARAKAFERKLTLIADEARAAHRTPADKRTPRQDLLVNQTARLVAVATADAVAAMAADDRTKHQELQQELKKLDSHKPPPLPMTLGLEDDATKPVKTRLLVRGELNHPAEEVAPAWPLVLSPKYLETRPALAPPRPQTTGRRAALAQWIADPQHPLTARVLVNRLWHHHFGRGIVATPSDFGVRGEPPTHPQLLDWLATEFVSPSRPAGEGRAVSPWSIKAMHRLILLSATYQQSTRASKETLAKDPDNASLSRMNRRRLEGEIIRDSLLSVSGRLNPKLGGPGVFPPLPPETKLTAKEWPVSASADEHRRRSVYIFARRNQRHPFLATFDLPDSNQSCAERQRSITGPQALALLNSADVTEAARALAERLTKQVASADERVVAAFQQTLARRPSADEVEWSREFLRAAPLSELCRALLNANEFLYVD